MRIPHRPSPNLQERAVGAALCVASLTLLLVAAWLTPSESGHGTHRSLGLPPCTWVALLDKPCPTCGMTTAFSHAADGNLLASFRTQPMGMLLSLAAAAAFWIGLHMAVFGSRLGRLLRNLLRPSTMIAIALALVAAWLYKLATWA